MKKLLIPLLLIALTLLLQHCTEHESPATVEKVQFAFNMRSSADDGARLSAVELPSNASVLVTIENSVGETVLDHHMIDLLKVGDRYMSKPIDLVAGNYKLVDFMLVNNEDEVLYAAPKHGSPLASAVTNPVPFSFYVSKDNVSNISVEVLNVQHSMPEAFGYASFNISIKNGSPLQIAVMEPGEEGYTLTAAKAWLVQEDDTIASFNLQAKINTVTFEHDSTKILHLIVEKDGYHREHQWFWYHNVDAPITIYLMDDTELRWTRYHIQFEVMIDTVDPFTYVRDIIATDTIDYPNTPPVPEFTGDFLVGDYASMDVSIENNIASVHNIFNGETRTVPNPVYVADSVSCFALLPEGEIMDIQGGSGHVSYLNESPTLHVNLQQQEWINFSMYFRCFWLDTPADIYSIKGDYLSNFTMDLSDEDGYQTFYIRDGTIKVTVQPSE